MKYETAKKLQAALQVYEAARTRLQNSVEEGEVVKAADDLLVAKAGYKMAVDEAKAD